jgi:hypothetical protein
MTVKHYILTNDGHITEYSAEEAFRVANGMRTLPEYADSRQRYIQVQFDEQGEDKLQIRIAGAYVSFDAQGQLRDANALVTGGEHPITPFEHDTCVQLALRGALNVAVTLH